MTEHPKHLLTLDTNVVRDFAWAEGLGDANRYRAQNERQAAVRQELALLKGRRDAGECEIGVLHRLLTDFDADVLPEFVQALVGTHVVLSAPDITIFPFTFDAVFVNDAVLEAILHAVFPEVERTQRKYKGKYKDAVQLYAHLVAKRDYFITSDKRILAARASLIAQFGIVCMTLAEYLGSTPPN